MAKQKLFVHEVNVSTIPTCPVCRCGGAEYWSFKGDIPHFEGWCPACTNVKITHSAIDVIRNLGKAHLLTAFLKEASDADWDTINCIDGASVESLASSIVTIPLIEQFDRLLAVLCQTTSRFGASSTFSYISDWPLVRARDSDEVVAMLRELKTEGYLETHIPPKPTRKAFERYSEMLMAGPMSQQAFVAMAFAPKYDSTYNEIIVPGITAAGYMPFRVDKKEHADKVDDLIIAEIRRSKFVVADFSGQRGGVYFEAGFAHGLGRPVIWMCRDDEKNDLHFDTRQFNHILYTDAADARAKLRNRIVAVVDEGTYKVGT